MNNVLLVCNDDIRKIIEFKKIKSYTFSPKNKTEQFYRLKKVDVYDEKRIQNIIVRKYSILYKRLSKIIKDVLDSDDTTESDYIICLDEISKLKSKLLIKYQELLKKDAFEYFLNDLCFLEKTMKDKIIEFQMSENYKRMGV